MLFATHPFEPVLQRTKKEVQGCLGSISQQQNIPAKPFPCYLVPYIRHHFGRGDRPGLYAVTVVTQAVDSHDQQPPDRARQDQVRYKEEDQGTSCQDQAGLHVGHRHSPGPEADVRWGTGVRLLETHESL